MTEHNCTKESKIERNEKDIQDLWKSHEALRKGYVPIWAACVFALLCSAVTLLSSILVHISR